MDIRTQGAHLAGFTFWRCIVSETVRYLAVTVFCFVPGAGCAQGVPLRTGVSSCFRVVFKMFNIIVQIGMLFFSSTVVCAE